MCNIFHLKYFPRLQCATRGAWPLLVYNNGRLLPFCPTPTYLGVKLDRSLTFCHHLVALRIKLSLCVTMLRRLVVSRWGAGAKTLRIATLTQVYSTIEYCAPVWCRSAHTHLPHRQCFERRLAHSHWMPASHSNGPPTYTLRHLTS